MRLSWIWGTLLACCVLQAQAVVKEYAYDDGDRLRQFKAEPVKLLYQHDSAGNRNTKLILNKPVTNPHTDIAFNLAQTNLNSVDPNGQTPLQWQLQGKDQNQFWQYIVSLYQEGKSIFQQVSANVNQILLPILESGSKYRLKLEVENAYHQQLVLENELQTSNQPPSKPSLSVFLNATHQYEAQWDSTDQDVLDTITYTLEVQGLLEDQTQWSVLYQGDLTSKTIPLSTKGLAGSKQLKFRVAVTDGKSAPVYSDVKQVVHSLVNFENDDFDGFYFWTAENQKGVYKPFSPVEERWVRQPLAGGGWGYGWTKQPDSRVSHGLAATYVNSQGGLLIFELSKPDKLSFRVYANGSQVYASNFGAIQGERVVMTMPVGPTRLVFEAYSDHVGERVSIDNLILTGVSDSDQDGLADGFEIAHYDSLDAYTRNSLEGIDSDNDGLTDLEEHQLGSEIHTADSDNDGLPDAWEHQYGLPLTQYSSDRDSDQDGATDREEWLQGSDPFKADGARSLVIDFESDDFNGFYFWTAQDGYGTYKASSPVSERWVRQQSNSGSWSYGWKKLPGSSTLRAYTATYIDSKGGQLRFRLNATRHAQLKIYANGEWIYSDDRDLVREELISIKVPTGPVRLVFEAYSNFDNEQITIDDLLLTGVDDSDQDGLADGFEIAHFDSLDAYTRNSLEGIDSDNDGLTDLEEHQLGSEIHTADSDNDGLPDAWEHQYGLPLTQHSSDHDSDQDGASDMEEWLQGSDPSKADGARSSTIDFESDDFHGFYFWTAQNSYGTYKVSSPINERWTRQPLERGGWGYRWSVGGKVRGYAATYVDSKGGHLKLRFSTTNQASLTIYANGSGIYTSNKGSVQDEAISIKMPVGPTRLVFEAYSHHANQAVSIDKLLLTGVSDSDQDGLADGFEIAHYGSLDAYTLSSLESVDSDNDGLSDLEELQLNSEIHSADSDNDGLPDAWEHRYGLPLTQHSSDHDSDQDGANDMEEYRQGTDPSKADGARVLTIDFASDDFSGFYLWTARNKQGDLKTASHVNERWTRQQTASGEWVYRWAKQPGSKIKEALAATYVNSQGGQLTFKLSQSKRASLTLFANGAKIFSTRRGALQNELVAIDLPIGSTTLVFKAHSNYDNNEVFIDDLLLTGVSDSDQDGLSDGFEIAHYGRLNAHTRDSLGLSGSKQPKGQIVATDERSAHSDRKDKHSLITFETEDLNGVYFWTARNKKGAYKQAASQHERWARQQTDKGEWVYRWARQPGSKIKQGLAATYVNSQGGQLTFKLSHSNRASLTIFANGSKIYASSRGSEQGKRVAVKMPIGPTTLVFKAHSNHQNNAVMIDDLLLTGPSDSDQDGVSDGFEIAHYGSLEAHTLDSLMTLDSDNDGVSDFDEYQNGTSPTTAGK